MGIPCRTPSKSHGDHGNFDGRHHLPAVLLANNNHPQGPFNIVRVDCSKSQQPWHQQMQLSQLDYPTRNPYQDFSAPNRCCCQSPQQWQWSMPAQALPFSLHQLGREQASFSIMTLHMQRYHFDQQVAGRNWCQDAATMAIATHDWAKLCHHWWHAVSYQ